MSLCGQEIKFVWALCGHKTRWSASPGGDQSLPSTECKVDSHGWIGVGYDFLGGDLGRFRSLEDLYLASPSVLRRYVQGTPYQRELPEVVPRVMADLLTCLETTLHKTGHVNSEAIWDGSNAPSSEAPTSPPFALTGSQKARILESLAELRPLALGKQTVNSTEISSIRSCVLGDITIRGGLDRRMVICPVHGDLNSANVMIWLANRCPFLIDFACFHDGLVSEDYAKLEADIKLRLMGHERAFARTGLGYGLAGLESWVAMEDDLVRWRRTLNTAVAGHGVERAFSLIQQIRDAARARHIAIAGSRTSFRKEYLVALLYHTIRGIGFAELPASKRLLAIYSVAHILDFLQM